jgi:hypothetical protein
VPVRKLSCDTNGGTDCDPTRSGQSTHQTQVQLAKGLCTRSPPQVGKINICTQHPPQWLPRRWHSAFARQQDCTITILPHQAIASTPSAPRPTAAAERGRLHMATVHWTAAAAAHCARDVAHIDNKLITLNIAPAWWFSVSDQSFQCVSSLDTSLKPIPV